MTKLWIAIGGRASAPAVGRWPPRRAFSSRQELEVATMDMRLAKELPQRRTLKPIPTISSIQDEIIHRFREAREPKWYARRWPESRVCVRAVFGRANTDENYFFLKVTFDSGGS